MIFIDFKNTDPFLNLAAEEFVLRNFDLSAESYLMVYTNGPSVILGKNQNIFEEADYLKLLRNNIPVIRRISGGGAVFHDEGNINFTYIRKFDTSLFNNYREFTNPILSVLQKLNINAGLNERNDIVIDGLKISGNAQFTSRDRMLSHGTLLFDSDLILLSTLLQPMELNISSGSTKSIKSKVTNISSHLREQLEISEFVRKLISGILDYYGDGGVYSFSNAELKKIKDLSETKYKTWNWNYGETPKFSLKTKLNNDSGEVELYVVNGIITQTAAVDKHFIIPESIQNKLAGLKIDDYIKFYHHQFIHI